VAPQHSNRIGTLVTEIGDQLYRRVVDDVDALIEAVDLKVAA
jgi:hypothetical protein